MKIIDMHTHCFPDQLAIKALSKLQKTSGLDVCLNGTAAELERSTRLAGIDYSVVQPIATSPEQTERVNRWALAMQNEKILSFGTIHPDFSGWPAEIKWLKANGFRGIKFHPEYQDFYVDHPEYFPIYEAVFAAGMMVLFHAGADLSYKEPFHCTPERLAGVLEAFPGGVIIAAHMGGYQYWDDVEKHLIGRDILLDTSFSLQELGPSRMIKMIREHGASRILFGSDSPWRDQSVEMAGIQALDLTAAEKSAILGGNAAKLLGWEEP